MNVSYYTQLRKFYGRMSFYITHFAVYFIPQVFFRWRKTRFIASLPPEEKAEADRRACYYCQAKEGRPQEDWVSVTDYRYPYRKKHKFVTYFFDLYDSLRYFSPNLRFSYLFGDVNTEPAVPTFVKSRPIHTTNGVVMKLNQVRHFRFVDDPHTFAQKEDRLVCRFFLSPNQPQRVRFLETLGNTPLCDIGIINKQTAHEYIRWQKPFMTISQMLHYKFIACIEGNDVATSLKWVMSSNSVAVMPKPKFETWFMEGTLQADYHYIEVKDDYSDLKEKVQYYIAHPDEAEAIIRHAHEHVAQFRNKRLERATSLFTAERYFMITGQIR